MANKWFYTDPARWPVHPHFFCASSIICSSTATFRICGVWSGLARALARTSIFAPPSVFEGGLVLFILFPKPLTHPLPSPLFCGGDVWLMIVVVNTLSLFLSSPVVGTGQGSLVSWGHRPQEASFEYTHTHFWSCATSENVVLFEEDSRFSSVWKWTHIQIRTHLSSWPYRGFSFRISSAIPGTHPVCLNWGWPRGTWPVVRHIVVEY